MISGSTNRDPENDRKDHKSVPLPEGRDRPSAGSTDHSKKVLPGAWQTVLAMSNSLRTTESSGETLDGLSSLFGNSIVRAAILLFLLTAVFVAVLAIHPPSNELRLASYLPLHTLLETASLVVCTLVFLISRTSTGNYPSRNLLILGSAFLGVALLDFQHILSYAGMPDFVTPGSPSKAINFWLAARLLTASALLVAAFTPWEMRAATVEGRRWTGGILILVAIVSWIFLFRPEWVPETFVAGGGLTPLKIGTEYLIIGLSLIAACGFYRQSQSTDRLHRHDPVALMTACIVIALSEMFFTLYTDVNGLFNVLGHIYKVVAAWFIYRGLVALNLGELTTRLQMARNAGGVALFDMDLTTGKGEWEDDFQQLLGLRPDTEKTFDNEIARVHPEDRAKFLAERSLRLAKGGSFNYEVRILSEDDTERWIEIHGEVRQDEHGKPIRSIGAGMDITTHKLAEAALAESNAKLEARVAERTQELQAEIRQREVAQAALSQAQRMEAFGQLAGGIAHDFNNLLTVVTGNNELLEMKLKDDKQLELLSRSTAAAEMGSRLTARLLSFSRQRKLEPAMLNLNDQIGGMTELMRRSIGEHINLETNLDSDLWTVRVDPSEIENAVLNLAINARDAMPNGGTITIETANSVVSKSHDAISAGLSPGEYARLTVVDTGAGMTPEVMQRAMEPFFTTKAPGKGTGLGLATIFGAMHQSGGGIVIDSVVDQGTTIALYLPRLLCDTKQPTSPAPNDLLSANREETILVVEDNPEVRELTVSRLELLGHHVLEAENGPSALNALEQNDIDLVFSDVVMAGGMSGYDLARRVRDNWPSVKILLTSGYADPATEQAPSDFEIKVLAKPYRQADFDRALREVLAE